MKGYKFYAEMEDIRSSKSASKRWLAFTRKTLESMAVFGQRCNVIAVLLDEKGQPLWCGSTDMMDAICPVSDRSNAPVELGLPTLGYLRTRCIRIDEQLARKLHPTCFTTWRHLCHD